MNRDLPMPLDDEPGVLTRGEVPTPGESDITLILSELSTGTNDTAVERLLPLVYAELRKLSQSYLQSERRDHTLQATALVHEAYVRLAGDSGRHWKDRAHFFRVAAKTMRRILINHARSRNAAKRGRGRTEVELHEPSDDGVDFRLDLEALDLAMNRLAEMDRDKAHVVELRFFGGCSIDETAESMNISTATVERHWRFARAWLRAELME